MLLLLSEGFNLPLSICCLALIAESCFHFFNEFILILNIIIFHLVDLLLYMYLRNKQISLHQSSNSVQLPSNHHKFETILFSTTACSNIAGADADTIDIFSSGVLV